VKPAVENPQSDALDGVLFPLTVAIAELDELQAHILSFRPKEKAVSTDHPV
jgi:hypothetical protein